MEKKKLDDLTKIKLIYSGELIVIAIVALVIGILQLTQVLTVKELFRNIFNWVTIFGSPLLIITSIISIISPKRRKKISIFDKITLFPLAVYIIVIDIICFANYGTLDQSFYQTYIPIAILCLSVIPSLLDELEQERIDKITYKVLEKNSDGSVRALHIESNNEFLFTDTDIKENVDELFCLDQYPNAIYKEAKSKNND